MVDEVKDNEFVLREFVRQTLLPYLGVRHTPVTRGYAAELEWPGMPADSATAVVRYDRLLNDPEFEVLLSYRYVWTLGARTEYADAIEETERILELLDEAE